MCLPLTPVAMLLPCICGSYRTRSTKSKDQRMLLPETRHAPPFPDKEWGKAKRLEEAARWLWEYLKDKPDCAADSWTIKLDASRNSQDLWMEI